MRLSRRQFFEVAAGAVALAAIPELPGFDALPIGSRIAPPPDFAWWSPPLLAITDLRLISDLRIADTPRELVSLWLVSPTQRLLLVVTPLPAGTVYHVDVPILLRHRDRLVIEGPAVLEYVFQSVEA